MKKIAMLVVLCLVLGCTGCAAREKTYEDTVQEILDGITLEKTAAPLVLGGITEDEDWERYVYGPVVMQDMVKRQSNPIALFQALVAQGVYPVYADDPNMWMDMLAEEELEYRQTLRRIPDVRLWEEREYDTNRDLLREVLRMSAVVDDGAAMEPALLNQYENVTWDYLNYSEQDQCYYCYSICYNDYAAYILAVYLRTGDDDTDRIADVEVQFLRLAYQEGGWAGSGYSSQFAYCHWENQAMALIGSLEKLMTGHSRMLEEAEKAEYGEFGGFQMPETYELGDYTVEIQKKSYMNLGYEGVYYDEADLVNYRIHK